MVKIPKGRKTGGGGVGGVPRLRICNIIDKLQTTQVKFLIF